MGHFLASCSLPFFPNVFERNHAILFRLQRFKYLQKVSESSTRKVTLIQRFKLREKEKSKKIKSDCVAHELKYSLSSIKSAPISLEPLFHMLRHGQTFPYTCKQHVYDGSLEFPIFSTTLIFL